MLKEGPEQVGAPVFGQQRVSDFLGQVVNIPGDAVRHLALLGMPPTLRDDVQLRRRRGQELHVDPCAIEITEQSRRLLVSAEAVPDEEQWALAMPAEVLDKGKDLVAGDVGGDEGKIESHTLTHGRDGEGAGHCEAIVAVPTVLDGGVPLRCPGAAHGRLHHETSLSKKNNRTALTPGFF